MAIAPGADPIPSAGGAGGGEEREAETACRLLALITTFSHPAQLWHILLFNHQFHLHQWPSSIIKITNEIELFGANFGFAFLQTSS